MILQALVRYYDILSEDPVSPVPLLGYSVAGVSFALILYPTGELKGITRLVQNEMRGKKMVEAPLKLTIPEQLKRAGITPLSNFLCDNCAYVLGFSSKDEIDPAYAPNRFKAFRDFNSKLLSRANCPEAQAVVNFLEFIPAGYCQR